MNVQKQLREAGGIGKIVKLLFNGAQCETTHRALLAIRILTDKEDDRIEIMRFGGVTGLMSLLSAESHPEVRTARLETVCPPLRYLTEAWIITTAYS